jgi:hypothetical protein
MLKWVCLTMGYGHPKWLAGFVGKMLINHWIWGYPISLRHCKLNENVRIHSRPLTVQNHQQYMCFHTSPHSSYEKTDLISPNWQGSQQLRHKDLWKLVDTWQAGGRNYSHFLFWWSKMFRTSGARMEGQFAGNPSICCGKKHSAPVSFVVCL